MTFIATASLPLRFREQVHSRSDHPEVSFGHGQKWQPGVSVSSRSALT